jgi:intein/homing endonuclease
VGVKRWSLKKNFICKIIVFLRFENKSPLLKLTFDNGYELVVTKDHPLLLADMRWKPAGELALNDEITISCNLLHTFHDEISPARALELLVRAQPKKRRSRKTAEVA